jgi:hypothetical protein
MGSSKSRHDVPDSFRAVPLGRLTTLRKSFWLVKGKPGCETENRTRIARRIQAGIKQGPPYKQSIHNTTKIMIKTKLPLFSVSLALLATQVWLSAADSADKGFNASLANLYQVSTAESRSISPENFTGEKGKAGMATNGTGK